MKRLKLISIVFIFIFKLGSAQPCGPEYYNVKEVIACHNGLFLVGTYGTSVLNVHLVNLDGQLIYSKNVQLKDNGSWGRYPYWLIAEDHGWADGDVFEIDVSPCDDGGVLVIVAMHGNYDQCNFIKIDSLGNDSIENIDFRFDDKVENQIQFERMIWNYFDKNKTRYKCNGNGFGNENSPVFGTYWQQNIPTELTYSNSGDEIVFYFYYSKKDTVIIGAKNEPWGKEAWEVELSKGDVLAKYRNKPLSIIDYDLSYRYIVAISNDRSQCLLYKDKIPVVYKIDRRNSGAIIWRKYLDLNSE
jgi:hypothetical protein